MRYLIGFVLLLLALGTLRVVGCGDEEARIPCQTDEACDDDNECTDDVCLNPRPNEPGNCQNTEVGFGLNNPPPVFCDLDGVEQFYEDGICVSRICERRESCPLEYACVDFICNPVGDGYPLPNPCTNAICDEGTCTYTLEPNGSFCCYTWEAYDCTITHGCQYRCTQAAECRDGQCCLAGNCYESRPRGYGCDPFGPWW